MKPVIVRNVKIGEGKPKICVPIVGAARDAIISEAETFSNIPVDVAEWRADWYDEVFDTVKAAETAGQLRAALGDIPLLFTFRTSNEGGEKPISPEDYAKLNIKIARSGYVDLIDAEIFTLGSAVKRIINEAHKCGVRVIASNHDFQKTPDKDELVRRLCFMRESGADIPKIAVMPKSKRDVLTLLSATLEMSEKYPDCPVITMSMAGTGVISRLAGECFGSALTFGAASKASAPGQPGVKDLAQALEIIHKSM